ncbi:butyrophilin subfamily 2 member A2-like [Archocentrus centrarchus]|uniref:butyrophilin subfamily 2 member A2-like n=1 Tax=Archocentrus centrarchus TaxID=63155 RepID=UPI0011EA0F00|nr:butyrophilin subfamily 2 member A2-like [Archocentrus centrarchus]
MSIILLLITFSLFAPGEFRTTPPTQLIEVQEGDNATIQCQPHRGINLETYTFDVKRVDGNSSKSDTISFVYSRRHGKDHPARQMERYRNRVVLINEDLKRGVVTLVILSVQPADSGLYKCYIPKLNFTSFSTIVDKRNRTKETDFSTTTSVEEMTDESETGAATKEHQRHHVIIIAVTISASCLVVVVFVVLFKKGNCMSKKKSEGNTFELGPLRDPA